MITKEVNEWLKKVEYSNYSKEDLMEEFIRFSKYLTKEEMIFIKNKLQKLI